MSGSKCESSSWSPAKYHGAFSLAGVRFGLARPCSGRGERDPEAEHDRRGAERDHDVTHEQVRPGEHRVVDRPLGFGDRLPVDDAEQADATSVERRAPPGPSPAAAGAATGRSVASSAKAPTVERCTAKPSLRTRQMCTVRNSTSEHREHGDVERVEAQQRVLADLGPADQQVLEPPAEQAARSARGRCRP